jgi:hypothetical protein
LRLEQRVSHGFLVAKCVVEKRLQITRLGARTVIAWTAKVNLAGRLQLLKPRIRVHERVTLSLGHGEGDRRERKMSRQLRANEQILLRMRHDQRVRASTRGVGG